MLAGSFSRLQVEVIGLAPIGRTIYEIIRHISDTTVDSVIIEC